MDRRILHSWNVGCALGERRAPIGRSTTTFRISSRAERAAPTAPWVPGSAPSPELEHQNTEVVASDKASRLCTPAARPVPFSLLLVMCVAGWPWPKRTRAQSRRSLKLHWRHNTRCSPVTAITGPPHGTFWPISLRSLQSQLSRASCSGCPWPNH